MAYKNINVSRLLLNPENDRFEPTMNQKEALDVMLSKMGNKIYRIARHILENGLSPKPLYVVEAKEGNKYLVKDGNRRTTAIKLMARPTLIDSKKFPLLRKNFQTLNNRFMGKPIKTIYCYVYEDPQTADKWVKLEHTGEQNGVGLSSWDNEQIQRNEIKHGKVPSVEIQVVDFLRKSPFTTDETKRNIEKISFTNLNRLISDSCIRHYLGLEISDGNLASKIEEEEIIKGLSTIVDEISSLTFKVSKIYTKDKRNVYIKSLDQNKLPDLNRSTERLWNLNNPDAEIVNIDNEEEKQDGNNPDNHIKTTKRTLTLSTDRKSFIPKKCNISISNPRINDIFIELQNMPVLPCRNAVAVLFRVFIELSIDTYIDDNKLAPITSQTSGKNFQQKILQVCNHLESKKAADKNICQGIKNEAKDKNSPLSPDTLHAYVHNNQFSPKAEDLLTAWNNIEKFMVILWGAIKA